MLDLAILGLLKDGHRHGYELKKQLGALLGPWSAVSPGSLYPALSRLEDRGEIEAVHHAGTDLAMPMTGALSGEVAAYRARRPAVRGQRNKKVYAITPTGEARLHELLTEGTGRHRDRSDERTFAVRVAFCRHLAPRDRLELFRQRRGEIEARLEQQPDDQTDDPYLDAVRDHDRTSLAQDLSWLDGLIAEEHRLLDDAPAPASSAS